MRYKKNELAQQAFSPTFRPGTEKGDIDVSDLRRVCRLESAA
jgi:hypothetical protein